MADATLRLRSRIQLIHAVVQPSHPRLLRLSLLRMLQKDDVKKIDWAAAITLAERGRRFLERIGM